MLTLRGQTQKLILLCLAKPLAEWDHRESIPEAICFRIVIPVKTGIL